MAAVQHLAAMTMDGSMGGILGEAEETRMQVPCLHHDVSLGPDPSPFRHRLSP